MHQQRPISTSTQHLKQVSNETPNDISVVDHQDISVACIHNVLFVHLYDVSCNSQMKHPIMLLWYVSPVSQYYVATMLLCQQVFTIFSSYFVTISIWQVSMSHLSIKLNTTNFSSTNQEVNKRSSSNYKVAELLFITFKSGHIHQQYS